MTFISNYLIYLKSIQGNQKTGKLPTTWNKMHTLCLGHLPCPVAPAALPSSPAVLPSHRASTTPVLPNTEAPTAPGQAQAAASAWLRSWLPLLIPEVLTQTGFQKNTRVLPVIICHSSLLIFFGKLTHYVKSLLYY